MATKASGTLVFIIENKYAPWGHMVSASPSLELRLWCPLRIASEWPLVDPSCPYARVVVHVSLELVNDLLRA